MVIGKLKQEVTFPAMYMRGVMAAVVGVVIVSACLPSVDTRHPETWRIPDGYKGWIYTKWGVAQCPSTPLQNGKLVIEVPRNGVYCTSTPFEAGAATDRFLYVRSDGTEAELPRSSAQKRVYQSGEVFVFIGSLEDSGKVAPNPPASYDPR